jgi:hypothetical protein
MDGKHDPFHQNNQIVYQTDFVKKLHENTQTFPKAIAMTLSIPPSVEHKLIWWHTNKFMIDSMQSWESILKSTEWFTYEPGRTIFNNVYTEGIALDGKIVPMHSIGDELITNGKVKKIKDRRHRRSDKMVTGSNL